MAKRPGRPRNQLPTCYYEGYLEKRSFKDKTSRKLWTCLCGNTLFFFNEKRDPNYIEKVDLSGLISITDDNSRDRNIEGARLNLKMKDGNIKFTAPNAETRELWKGYIHSVAELTVPSSVNLLPGQIRMLEEAVEKEKERQQTSPPPLPPLPVAISSPYVSLRADMPTCYHGVSRVEAELLLEREANRGNLLLRPGSDGDFAVTTRLDLNGTTFKHYRVNRKHDGGFVIDVDNAVSCATLHEVIDYLVEKTEGVFIPLIIEEVYEKRISFVRSDKENGERSVQQAPSNSVPPTVPPKPAPRIPTPEPVSAPLEEENEYLNNKLEEAEKKEEDSSAAPLPQLEKLIIKKAMMPPAAAPHKQAPSTLPPSSTNCRDVKMKVHQESIEKTTISELKAKLGAKTRSQE